MIKKYSVWLFILLLLADQTYSFYQECNGPNDDDLANIVAPNKYYAEVLHDPLGMQVLFENKVYSAPNRFFAHGSLYAYFRNVPNYFHAIADPVQSYYLSCATAKTLMQISLILALAVFISIERLTFRNVILAAVLVTPMFQTFGYNRSMGIIDYSTTYAFFYALPTALLLWWFFPFYKGLFKEEKISLSWLSMFVLAAMTVILSLNGPLTPAIVLVVCPMVLLRLWYVNFQRLELPFVSRAYTAVKEIPTPVLVYFILFCIMSVYSIYIGLNNSENANREVSVLERYSRLPLGLFKILTNKIGYVILLLCVFANVYLLKRFQIAERHKLLSILKWIGVFTLVYTLLLPLGGYREYRPNIIRYDTYIPVTLCLIYFFGISTFYLLPALQAKFKTGYTTVLVAVLVLFTVAEFDWKPNTCERAALYRIYNSPPEEKIIVFEPMDCNVFSWTKIENYKDSEVIMTYLQQCGIARGKKYYYQK